MEDSIAFGLGHDAGRDMRGIGNVLSTPMLWNARAPRSSHPLGPSISLTAKQALH